jgi:predicted XRE-type DNA-binding protein
MREFEGEHIIFEGARDRYGHGRTSRRIYGTQDAYVIAWIDAYGSVPQGKQINHACDRPDCINPEHLYAGTQSENLQDAASAGTLNTVKLTEDDVREIRSWYKIGMKQTTIAEVYGVTQANVSAIVTGKTWRHVS